MLWSAGFSCPQKRQARHVDHDFYVEIAYRAARLGSTDRKSSEKTPKYGVSDASAN